MLFHDFQPRPKETVLPQALSRYDIAMGEHNDIVALVRVIDFNASWDQYHERAEACAARQVMPVRIYIPVADTLLFSSYPPPWFPKERLTGSLEDLGDIETECERKGGTIDEEADGIFVPFSRLETDEERRWQYEHFRHRSFEEAWRFFFGKSA